MSPASESEPVRSVYRSDQGDRGYFPPK